MSTMALDSGCTHDFSKILVSNAPYEPAISIIALCCLHDAINVFTAIIMCRCFTFGIGSGASTALVEGLAHAGNGTAEFVKFGERLQPKV